MQDSVPEAMNAMVELCRVIRAKHPEGPNLVLQVLPIFYHHLQHDLPGPEKWDDPMLPFPPHMILAFTAITAIYQCLSCFTGAVDREVVSSVGDHWPSIWRWSEYIINQRLGQPTDPLIDMIFLSPWVVRITMARLFLLMALPNRCLLAHLMATTPGFTPTLIRLYLWPSQDEDSDSSIDIAAKALQHVMASPFIDLGGSSIQEIMEKIMNTLRVPPTEVAAKCLKLVNNQALPYGSQIIDCDALLGGLVTISASAIVPSELSRALISKRSISSMTRVFSRLTSYKATFRLSPANYAAAVTCLKLCGQYMVRYFEQGGLVCVVEAVEGRLLTSILKSFQFLRYDLGERDRHAAVTLNSVLLDLINMVETYSIYRSVLCRLRRSLLRIDNHLTVGHLEGNPVFRDPWYSFMETVEERMSYKREWDERGYNFCENEMVSSMPP